MSMMSPTLTPTPACANPQARAVEQTKMRRLRSALNNLHWALTVMLASALLPASALVKLNLRIHWSELLSFYWVGLGSRSIFVAVFLYLIGFPLRETLLPTAARYRKEKLRLAGLAVFAGLMLWEFGLPGGLILVVFTVLFADFFDRVSGDPSRLGQTFLSFFLVGSYFFLGLVLVYCYNDVIASMKFAGRYDWFFSRLDMLLLRGVTVSSLAHAAARHLPLAAFDFLTAVYFGMFLQIGAAAIILVLAFGRKHALQYVGTLLTAYYISLAVFFLWPSMGPFSICSTHDAAFPNALTMYAIHKTTVLKAHTILDHSPISGFTTDYYIGFPCMHIAQPVIVAWFLRRWKRILTLLIGFDVVLIVAILLLEQHYVVDVLGGIIVAALAIRLINFGGKQDSAIPERHMGNGERVAEVGGTGI